MPKPDISIIIPAYNEEKSIASAIENLVAELNRHGMRKHEIIIVAEGDDGTASAAASIGNPNIKVMLQASRSGKGRCISHGFQIAKGAILGFVDADESISASDAASMALFLKRNHDIGGVIASRRLHSSKILSKQSYLRRFLSFSFNMLVRLVLSLRYYDTQCGAKFFRRSVITGILPFQTSGFGVDVEMLYRIPAQTKIIEYPVMWSNRKDSRLSMLSIPSMFIEVMRLRK
jgi:dolichyl-phosphate beta-glucosyltransferase